MSFLRSRIRGLDSARIDATGSGLGELVPMWVKEKLSSKQPLRKLFSSRLELFARAESLNKSKARGLKRKMVLLRDLPQGKLPQVAMKAMKLITGLVTRTALPRSLTE